MCHSRVDVSGLPQGAACAVAWPHEGCWHRTQMHVFNACHTRADARPDACTLQAAGQLRSMGRAERARHRPLACVLHSCTAAGRQQVCLQGQSGGPAERGGDAVVRVFCGELLRHHGWVRWAVGVAGCMLSSCMERPCKGIFAWPAITCCCGVGAAVAPLVGGRAGWWWAGERPLLFGPAWPGRRYTVC